MLSLRARLRRGVRRAVLVTAGIAMGAGLISVPLAAPASAANVWVIQNANSPSTGRPLPYGGTWITNKADGYYLGWAASGWVFDDEYTSGANWHWGRSFYQTDMCGWAMPGSMGSYYTTVSNSCSSATMDSLSHRLTIGYNFNAPAHQAQGGYGVPATNGCTMYYNYYYGTNFGSNGGHWADPPGTISQGWVAYRYTTLDGQAAEVRDPVWGWGFVPIGCVNINIPVYNDND